MNESIDARIVSALDALAPVWNAVKEDEHETPSDEPDTYYTFQYSTRGDGYADDEPTAEVALIMLHLWAPLNGNLSTLIRRTKSAIHAAGFTWPEKIDASDEKGRHIVFEFQDAEGVDFNGEV